MSDDLSSRQKDILEFIGKFSKERGYPPSIRDIMQGCHISSTSVVNYNLEALAKAGKIRRDPEVARGIVLA